VEIGYLALENDWQGSESDQFGVILAFQIGIFACKKAIIFRATTFSARVSLGFRLHIGVQDIVEAP